MSIPITSLTGHKNVNVLQEIWALTRRCYYLRPHAISAVVRDKVEALSKNQKFKTNINTDTPSTCAC